MIQKEAIYIFESSFQQGYRPYNSLPGIFSLIDTKTPPSFLFGSVLQLFKINSKNGKDEWSLVSPIISLIEIINIITAIILLL